MMMMMIMMNTMHCSGFCYCFIEYNIPAAALVSSALLLLELWCNNNKKKQQRKNWCYQWSETCLLWKTFTTVFLVSIFVLCHKNHCSNFNGPKMLVLSCMRLLCTLHSRMKIVIRGASMFSWSVWIMSMEKGKVRLGMVMTWEKCKIVSCESGGCGHNEEGDISRGCDHNKQGIGEWCDNEEEDIRGCDN